MTTKLATAYLAVALFTACDDGTPPELVEAPLITRVVEEVHRFDSLEQMVLVADLVVEGRVIALEAGPEVGPAHHREKLGLAVIEIDRVHKGSPPADGVVEVAFAEWLLMTDHGPRRISRADGGDAYQVGEQGLYALGRDPRSGAYAPLSAHSRIPLVDGRVALVSPPRALAASLEGIGADELRGRLAVAVKAVSEGRVTPPLSRVPAAAAR